MNIKKSSGAVGLFFFSMVLYQSSNAAIHDPTKPVPFSVTVDEAVPSANNFNLQSIIISPMRRLAMINGQMVGTGSKIQGARVLAIDKNHVVLFYEGHRKILYLFDRRLWKVH